MMASVEISTIYFRAGYTPTDFLLRLSGQHVFFSNALSPSNAHPYHYSYLAERRYNSIDETGSIGRISVR